MGKTVYEVVADTFNKPTTEIRDELSFGSIPEWDSLGHISLMVALEKEFSLEITPERIAQLLTVGDIQKAIGIGGSGIS